MIGRIEELAAVGERLGRMRLVEFRPERAMLVTDEVPGTPLRMPLLGGVEKTAREGLPAVGYRDFSNSPTNRGAAIESVDIALRIWLSTATFDCEKYGA